MEDLLIEKAAKHLGQILDDALCMKDEEHVLVIHDEDSPLAKIITEGYKKAYPRAELMDFHKHSPEEVIAKVRGMNEKDAVLLVQSTNFRLNEFRFRIELFQKGLKTVEHIHLARMLPEQYEIYIDALAYDKEYYHTTGHYLKNAMDTSAHTIVKCHGGTELVYESGMESSKLNIGDYSQMKNVGGTFPIGEVFTEASDFSKVNGEAMIFAFANMEHKVTLFTPFKVLIKESIVIPGEDAPKEFHDLLDLIREDEAVTMREFGLGLNPAMGKHHVIADITAFERMRGLHVSLGAKHTIYAKPGFHKKRSRYHIDVFFDVSSIEVDGKEVFDGEQYVVAST